MARAFVRRSSNQTMKRRRNLLFSGTALICFFGSLQTANETLVTVGFCISPVLQYLDADERVFRSEQSNAFKTNVSFLRHTHLAWRFEASMSLCMVSSQEDSPKMPSDVSD